MNGCGGVMVVKESVSKVRQKKSLFASCMECGNHQMASKKGQEMLRKATNGEIVKVEHKKDDEYIEETTTAESDNQPPKVENEEEKPADDKKKYFAGAGIVAGIVAIVVGVVKNGR
jgi:DNA-directed RNA polymerase subunit M/transcription elongation factor TFIIS